MGTKQRCSYVFREVLEAFLEKGMPELGIEKEESASQTSWERASQAEAQGNSRWFEEHGT